MWADAPLTGQGYLAYKELADGYLLTRDMMQWFWDQYTTDPAETSYSGKSIFA